MYWALLLIPWAVLGYLLYVLLRPPKCPGCGMRLNNVLWGEPLTLKELCPNEDCSYFEFKDEKLKDVE